MKFVTAALTVACVLAQEPPLSVFHSEARLVEIYASIFDQKGNPIDGIARDRFQVMDNGAMQPIVTFESDAKDLTCAILLDTTGSMQTALPAVKNAVSGLLDQMREGDAAGVFSFNTSLKTLQDFTVDKAAARRAVLRTRAAGSTALFDAIAEVSKMIAPRAGKKAVVLFTDGSDNSSSLRADAAIARVLTTGVPIYAVAEGEATSSSALKKQLRMITDSTGGVLYEARTSKDVAKVFQDIQSELKHVYLLSYKPPETESGKWRNIDLKIAGLEKYTIRGKRGYYAD